MDQVSELRRQNNVSYGKLRNYGDSGGLHKLGFMGITVPGLQCQ